VPSIAVIDALGVLAVVCTAVAFLLFFALIAEVGPVHGTVITYVNPAVAAVLGVAVLHESFTLGMGLGFVLVLAGSILARRRQAPAWSASGADPKPGPGRPYEAWAKGGPDTGQGRAVVRCEE